MTANPDRAGSPQEQVRQRLAAAELLEVGGAPRHAPPPDDVAQARRLAGRGTPLSDIVIADR